MKKNYRDIITFLLSATFVVWANIAFSQAADETVVLNSVHTYSATGGAAWSYQWTLTDPDNNSTTLSSTETFNISQTEDITFTKLGNYVLRVQATNDKGCLSEVYTKTIEVVPIPNEAPIAISDTYTEIENTEINGDLLSNDSDPDGDPLTLTSVTVIQGTGGTLSWNPDGTFSFTPPTDFFGTIVYEYVVCDDYDTPACDKTIVTFKYTGNNRPVANDDSFTINQDTQLSANLISNDTDVDGNNLGTTAASKATSNGSVTINTDGTFVYTPNPGFFGSDQFTYEMCDDGIPSKCDEGNVTVTVLEVKEFNRVAVNDIVVVFENSTFTGRVLDNDINFSGGGITVNVPSGSEPINGVLTMNADGSFTYQPNAGFIGTDNFYYEVCASGEPVGCDEANVTVKVVPQEITNSNIVLNDDEAQTVVNVSVQGNVLANDFSPVDDELVVSQTPVQGVSHGLLVLNSDGSYQYTPDNDYIGEDYFIYRACGMTTGDCQTARVTIRVTKGTEVEYFAVDDVFQIFSDEAAIGNLLANDIVPSGSNITVNTTPISSPTKGSLAINANGSFTYTPGSGSLPFVDQFVYEACAPNGTCSRATVTIVVSEEPQNYADISVTKTAPASVSLGETISYEITVSNSGTLTAENVMLDDFLPNYILNPQYTVGGNGNASAWAGQLNLGNLGDGESVLVVITGMVSVSAPDNLENYASAQSDQYDPDLSNNYSTVQTATNHAPVIVVKNGLTQTIGCCNNGHQLDASQSSGNGQLSFLWEPSTGLNNPNSATPVFSGNSNTVYKLTVTSENGQSSSENVSITIAPCPEIILDEQVFVSSSNENVLLDATGSTGTNLSYYWWPDGSGQVLSGQRTATPVVSGVGKYFLQITDSYGCTELDSINVGLLVQILAVDDSVNMMINTSVDINVLRNDIPQMGIVPSTLSILTPPDHGVAVVSSDSIITYTPNQYYAGSDDFTYTICDFRNECDDATVLVIINDEALFVPNAFSPNNDGYNDYFVIKGINQYQGVKLKIFNRWGNLVYEANNYGEGTGRSGFWNGIANKGIISGSGDVPTGTYFYILDLGSGNEKLSGYIYIDR